MPLTELRSYAALPSSINSLHIVCLVSLQMPLCLSVPVQKNFNMKQILVLDRKHSFWVNLAENLKTVKSKLKHLKTLSLKPSIPFSVKKRPDVNSIFEYLNKELHNSNITPILIDTRLSTLTIDGKLEIKYPLGKASNWVKSNNALASSKSKTPT